MNNYLVISAESAGFRAWESATQPTPTALPDMVVPSGEATRLVLADGQLLETDVQRVDGKPDFQLYRFAVDVAPGDIRSMRVQWAGRGAGDETYGVYIWVWDFKSASWELGFAGARPDVALSEFAVSRDEVIDAEGNVWVLAAADKDVGDAHGRSLAADYVALALSHDGVPSSGSCTMCHSMHGASVDGTMPVGQVLTNEGRLCTGDGGLGCHGDAASAASSVATEFAASVNPLAQHDVMLEVQAVTGARLACSDCHNPHSNNASAPFSDPDDISVEATVGLDAAIGADGYAYLLAGARHDGNPPVITGLMREITGSRVVAPLITWTTDEKATSWVELAREVDWSTAASRETTGSDALVTAHSVVLPNLEVGTTYAYRVKSVDALGNVAYSDEVTYAPTASPVDTPGIGELTYDDGGATVPLPSELSGHGSLQFSVTVSEPDARLEYWFELHANGAMPTDAVTTTGWVEGTSAVMATPDMASNAYFVRVRARWRTARDVVSYLSAPSRSFVYSDLNFDDEPVAASVPDDGRVALGDSESSTDTLATTTSGTTSSEWLDSHEPISYYVPGAYSVVSNLMSVAVRRSDGVVSYVPVSAGWESTASAGVVPTPQTPGVPTAGSVETSTTALDHLSWRTGLAALDGDYNWQLVRFDVSAFPASQLEGVTFLWAGHGEPTPGYRTEVYAWDAAGGSWVELLNADTAADTNVNHTIEAMDTTQMCLRCHDGLPPDGVVFPLGLMHIGADWESATGDFHGDRAGTGFGSGPLMAPYARGADAVQCTVCHDSHGSESIYHIPPSVNGRTDIVVSTEHELGRLCVACHRGGVDAWHAPCVECHLGGHWAKSQDLTHLESLLPSDSSDCTACHGHSRSWAHPATCLRCHDETDLDLRGGTPDAPWTYGRTF